MTTHDSLPITLYLDGAPVADGTGVLTRANNHVFGVFAPWPAEIKEGVTFQAYLAASNGDPELWLQPDKVEIFRTYQSPDSSIGFVSFVQDFAGRDVPWAVAQLEEAAVPAALAAAGGDWAKLIVDNEAGSALTLLADTARPAVAPPSAPSTPNSTTSAATLRSPQHAAPRFAEYLTNYLASGSTLCHYILKVD